MNCCKSFHWIKYETVYYDLIGSQDWQCEGSLIKFETVVGIAISFCSIPTTGENFLFLLIKF
jgi:hypothetical protein